MAKHKVVKITWYLLFQIIPIIIVVLGILMDKYGYFDGIGDSSKYYWLLLLMVIIYYMVVLLISYVDNQGADESNLPDCAKDY